MDDAHADRDLIGVGETRARRGCTRRRPAGALVQRDRDLRIEQQRSAVTKVPAAPTRWSEPAHAMVHDGCLLEETNARVDRTQRRDVSRLSVRYAKCNYVRSKSALRASRDGLEENPWWTAIFR